MNFPFDVLPASLQTLARDDPPEPPLLNAYWMVPGRLMAGPYPGGYGGGRGAEAIRSLIEVGVTVFIDLTEEGEGSSYESYLKGRARHLRIAVRDFDTPSDEEMIRILDEIDQALLKGTVVYLHCFAGLGRTGTVVGCYLVRHGLDGDSALEAIRALRRDTLFDDSSSPQTEAQRRMVRNWRDRAGL